MRPRQFEYYSASSVQEALNLLQSIDDSKILAGGQSLLAAMKLRLLSPKALIDIANIRDLTYVREEDKAVRIGALTTHDALENSEIIQTNFPALIDATSVIADQQVRNRGTIAGSLAHADPSADLPTVLTALDAKVTIVGPTGSRGVDCSDLSTGYFSTVLKPDELITEITIPKLTKFSGTAYLKLSRRHGDFAIVAAATCISFNNARTCTQSRLVLGGVAEKPHRAVKTEQAMRGRILTPEVIGEAARSASNGLKPPTDAQASSEYRLKMCQVIAKRAITAATKRLKGLVS